MSQNILIQSSFLYDIKWTHEIDSVFLDTFIALKKAAGCEGNVFPSHFFFEVKNAIRNQLGHSFEWYELVDRLHFMYRRYKTFKEIIGLDETFWYAPTNTVIIQSPSWEEALERNPLLGAYYQRGDPAYDRLLDLFASDDVKEEREQTVIVLSETTEAATQVHAGPVCISPSVDYGEVNSGQRSSSACRKLMFDEGGPLDRESTNNKGVCYYVPDTKGKLERMVEEKGPRILPRMPPPNSPNLAYSSASNSPKFMWRMPRKPTI